MVSALQVDTIPALLKQHRQWVLWRNEPQPNGGKPDKVPYDAKTGARARINDPATWSSFPEALTRLERSLKFDGLNFALTAEDPYVAVDLDNCADPVTGEIAPWAREIVGLVNSYTELSPSRTGIRMFARGVLPPGGRKKGDVEVYAQAHFVSVTGHHLDGTPFTIEDRSEELARFHARYFRPPAPSNCNGNGGAARALDLNDQEVLRKMFAAGNGAAVRELWDGDFSDYPSQSEADLALCCHLVFWTGGNQFQTDRLFRESGLFRAKWDTSRGSETYGALTIRKACAACADTYHTQHDSGEERPKEAVNDEINNDTIPNSSPETLDNHAGAPDDEALTCLTWRQMVEDPLEPIEYFMPGWISTESFVLLVGAGESFKSWLALYLALMTANGTPAVEPADSNASMRQGPVVYITGENSIREEKRRCGLLKAGHNLPESLPVTFVPVSDFSLSADQDYARARRLIEAVQPVLIVLDSAIALSGLEDENNNTRVRSFLKSKIVPLARERGAVVLMLAHPPKPPTQPGARLSDEHAMRGAGDWRNCAEDVLVLRKEQPELPCLELILA